MVLCYVQLSLGTSNSKSQASLSQTREEMNVDPLHSDPSKPTRAIPAVGAAAGQIFAEIGLYKGVIIALKHIRKDHLQITRQVLLEFNDVSASFRLFII